MKQERLLELIDETHQQMMALLGDLSDEQLDVPYERGINPPVWEVGHSAFFYEYFLLRPLRKVDPLMPGYDPVWDSFDIPHRERWSPGVVPGKAETLDYYDRAVAETIDLLSRGNTLTDEESYLGQYVVAHQQMHLESLIWCRQTLGYQAPSFLVDEPVESNPDLGGDTAIPGGRYFIGVPVPAEEEKSINFSFDNERPGFDQVLSDFQISKTLVSRGEFAEFVDDGGYETAQWWSFGGNYWRRENKLTAPAYWAREGDTWTVRRFHEVRPLDPESPMLHVSFWEAEAYAKWAGRRLPTEFEWEVAARGPKAQKFPWGNDPDKAPPAALGSRNIGSAPVTGYMEGASPFGCLQMIGTAWEWTTSQYLPFAGFCVDMYAYMSTLQFGDHKTTRGGSAATSLSLPRNTYRQAIFPDRTDLFTGFRTCALQGNPRDQPASRTFPTS
ncbi:MAG: SUMF1/EgtB/PvdO family nonheme iron enzyme [Verrucomicrobiota bacterium]